MISLGGRSSCCCYLFFVVFFFFRVLSPVTSQCVAYCHKRGRNADDGTYCQTNKTGNLFVWSIRFHHLGPVHQGRSLKSCIYYGIPYHTPRSGFYWKWGFKYFNFHYLGSDLIPSERWTFLLRTELSAHMRVCLLCIEFMKIRNTETLFTSTRLGQRSILYPFVGTGSIWG